MPAATAASLDFVHRVTAAAAALASLPRARRTFPLTSPDLDERVVKWDYSRPYVIKPRESDVRCWTESANRISAPVQWTSRRHDDRHASGRVRIPRKVASASSPSGTLLDGCHNRPSETSTT